MVQNSRCRETDVRCTRLRVLLFLAARVLAAFCQIMLVAAREDVWETRDLHLPLRYRQVLGAFVL